MPRPQYPSDVERRKTRPHIKVHLTVATHRKTAAVWADPRKRGMLVELWRLAEEAYAGKNGGQLVLTAGPLQSLTGATRTPRAIQHATSLCDAMDYPWSRDGNVLTVTIRNFGVKQHGDSALRTVAPRTPKPSDSASDSASASEEERDTLTVGQPPPEVESEAERWVNVLAKEDGTREAKLAFLEEDLVRIKDEVIADLAPGKRDKEAVRAKTRSKILGWWRQRLKNPSGPPGRGRGRGPEMPPRIRETAGDLLSLPPVDKAKRAKNAEQAREMVAGLSKGRAMPEVR